MSSIATPALAQVVQQPPTALEQAKQDLMATPAPVQPLQSQQMLQDPNQPATDAAMPVEQMTAPQKYLHHLSQAAMDAHLASQAQGSGQESGNPYASGGQNPYANTSSMDWSKINVGGGMQKLASLVKGK